MGEMFALATREAIAEVRDAALIVAGDTVFNVVSLATVEVGGARHWCRIGYGGGLLLVVVTEVCFVVFVIKVGMGGSSDGGGVVKIRVGNKEGVRAVGGKLGGEIEGAMSATALAMGYILEKEGNVQMG